MKFLFVLLAACCILMQGCENKKENNDEGGGYFPALSFIKSQIAHVDTSVYRIIKIVKIENRTDTIFLKREQFKDEAKDFLSLPDISSNQFKDDYVETKQYDPELQQVSLMYLPKEKDEEAELVQQNIIIKPHPDGDKVTAIFADQYLTNEDDKTVQKKLFWEVDKRFKIVTITQNPDQSEKTETVEVSWN